MLPRADPVATPSPTPATTALRPALNGLRVMELGGFAAGPVVGKHLANYGAEVIRVESRARLDGFRTHYPPYKGNVPGIERAGIFSFFNDGKRSITLNLKTPQGVDIARRLVAEADVVLENFTPGTMAKLGLGYPTLSALNPRLVMLSTCNQGQYGPHAGHPGFGSHLTSLSGFTYLLGKPGETPVLMYGPYIDYIAVGYGLIAVLAGLARRTRTGRGTYIDLSQYESGLQFMAPALLDLFANGRVADRAEDRDLVVAPHGVFRCQGEDRWCAISAETDAEWQGLLAAIDAADWQADPRFATLAGRKAHEAEIEARLTAWTAPRDRDEVAAHLQRHGVRAYPVNSMADLFADPQLQHRGHWRPVHHPVQGTIHAAAPPFLLQSTPPVQDRPAPTLGADTTAILRDTLHLTEGEIATLDAAGALY